MRFLVSFIYTVIEFIIMAPYYAWKIALICEDNKCWPWELAFITDNEEDK